MQSSAVDTGMPSGGVDAGMPTDGVGIEMLSAEIDAFVKSAKVVASLLSLDAWVSQMGKGFIGSEEESDWRVWQILRKMILAFGGYFIK